MALTALQIAFERAQSTALPLRPAAPPLHAVSAAFDAQHTPPAANEAPPRMRGVTLGELLEEAALLDGWERVRRNGGVAGGDGQTVAAFGRRLFHHLNELQSELRAGRYLPRPLQTVPVPKASGGTRLLAIPCVRDRVVQATLAQRLALRLEPLMDGASHAYRTERSVLTALAQVIALRDAGLRHVVEADIEAFFDSVPHAPLLARVRPHLGEPAAMELLQRLLSPVIQGQGSSHLCTRGLPQGSPLSPLLANWALQPFDEALREGGHALVRYADDFVILCPSAEAARLALDAAGRHLQALGLRLHPRKSRVTHFDRGFTFLGVRFEGLNLRALSAGKQAMLPQLATAGADPDPLTQTDPAPSAEALADDPLLGHTQGPAALLEATATGPARAPLLQTVHVGEPGAALRLDGERLLVTRPQQRAVGIPLGQVDQIAISANAMVSTALLRHCSQRRIAVHLSDPEGGDASVTLERGDLPDLALLDAQRRHSHDPQAARLLAAALLEGKLHNSRVLLRRLSRRAEPAALAGVEDAIAQIDRAQANLSLAPDLAALRGHEGSAARAYFRALAALLPAELGFDGRRRRPPPDAVNVLLSYGYMVLHANAHTLLRLAGLNAHLGLLHRPAPGGLALVSDVIEEFRAPVVDAVVCAVLREGVIGLADFHRDPDAERPLRLQPEGRKRFLRALEQKLESRFAHPRLGQPVDYRRALQHQIQHLRQVLLGQEPRYLPLKFR